MKIANHLLLAAIISLSIPLASASVAEHAPQPATTSKTTPTGSSQTDTKGSKAGVAEATHQQAARYFAGLGAPASDADGKSLRRQAKSAWATYEKHVGQPLLKWAKQEVGYEGGDTVFYPFSGPDFLTVERIYPNASRYVLVAVQNAMQPVYPDKMDDGQRHEFVQKLGTAWSKFGTLGYFRTEDLDKDQHDTAQNLGVTTILMAFAARLGYEVVDVAPLGFSPEKHEWEPLPANEPKWQSVRLSLRKDGRKVTLDYIRLDLSDDGLRAHKSVRAWMQTMAARPTLLKAASHLLQEPYFEIMRNMLVKAAPIVVQDETGLDYTDLTKIGPVRLYGNFTKPHPLFKKTVQPALATAYKAEKSPGALPFAFSYLKGAEMRSIQIARRQPAQEKSSDGRKQPSLS